MLHTDINRAAHQRALPAHTAGSTAAKEKRKKSNTLRVMQVNNQSRTQHGALSLLPQQTNNNHTLKTDYVCANPLKDR